MKEIMHAFGGIFSIWLEPVGIIAGLIFSGVALRNDTRARCVENQIKISDGYREIWAAQVADPKLERILMSSLDLIANPISPVEARLVRFIFHLWEQNPRLPGGPFKMVYS